MEWRRVGPPVGRPRVARFGAVGPAVRIGGLVLAIVGGGLVPIHRGEATGPDDPPSVRLLLVTTPRSAAIGDGPLILSGARAAADALGVVLDLDDVDPGRPITELAAGYDGVGILDATDRQGWPAGVALAVLSRDGPASPEVAAVAGAALVVAADPRAAGALAASRLAERGARHILCLIDESGVPALEARCAGAQDGAPPGVEVELLRALDPAGDPSGPAAAIAGRLTAEPGIDAILVARAGVERAARAALDAAGSDPRRLLAIIGPPPADDHARDVAIDLGVDPRASAQGWALVVGLVVAVQERDPGQAPVPARLMVVPAAWP